MSKPCSFNLLVITFFLFIVSLAELTCPEVSGAEKEQLSLCLFWIVDKNESNKIDEYRYLLNRLEEFPQMHMNFSFSPLLVQQWTNSAPDIVAKLKKLQEQKQVTITFTPWYEPILPLIYDLNEVVSSTSSKVSLEKNKFWAEKNFSYPEDIREQMVRSWEFYQKIFNTLPTGFVPPAGAICDGVVDLLTDLGINWLLTASVRESNEYLPLGWHSVGSNKVCLFFRQNEISDFWDISSAIVSPKEKVKQWINLISQSEQSLVVVTIEARELWDTDSSKNKQMLEQIFVQTISQPYLLTVTTDECIMKKFALAQIEKIHPVTWLKQGFSAWIGESEKNTAWHMLTQARNMVERYKNSGHADIKVLDTVLEEIYVLEGGENFFYFSKDYAFKDKEKIELNFRQRLINIYQLIGQRAPSELFHPLASYSFLGTLLSEEEETKMTVNEEEKIFSFIDCRDDSINNNFDLENFIGQEVVDSFGEENLTFSFSFVPLITQTTETIGTPEFLIQTSSSPVERQETTFILQESSQPIVNISTSAPTMEKLIGLDQVIIDLYIDLNNRIGAGSVSLLAERKAYTTPQGAWEYCLSLEQKENAIQAILYRAREDGLPEEIGNYPVVQNEQKRKFSVSIPKKILRGTPFNWGYLVVVLNKEDKSILDLIVPLGKKQRQLLETTGLTPQLPMVRLK